MQNARHMNRILFNPASCSQSDLSKNCRLIMQTKITLQCIYNTNSVCFTDDEERLLMRSSRLYNFVNLGITLAKAYCNNKHSQIQHMIKAYMYFSVLSKIYIMLKKENQSTKNSKYN